MARIIVFISAAKNLGKTHLCVNLARHLAQLGNRTCLFNTDADAARVYNLLNIHPRHSLKDLIENRVRVEDVVIPGVHGIDFFPGSPGIEQLASADQRTRNRVHRVFMDCNRYDFFIVDTFSGLSRSVVALCKSSPEMVLVMTSDATSLKNAFFLLKTLCVNKYDGAVRVLINMSRDLNVARKSYRQFKETVSRYLPMPVIPLGTVFFDPKVRSAEAARRPFISLYPDSIASKCILNIARRLSDKKIEDPIEDLAVSAFWTRFIENLRHPFQILGKPQPASLPRAGVSAASGAVSRSDPGMGSGKSTRDALERLKRQLSRLSKEVSSIKQILQSVSEAQQAMNGSRPQTEISNPQKTETLVLDFEAFLEQRKGDSHESQTVQVFDG